MFKQVPEGYVAFLEELPGANTQGTTLEEARENLPEAAQLMSRRIANLFVRKPWSPTRGGPFRQRSLGTVPKLSLLSDEHPTSSLHE